MRTIVVIPGIHCDACARLVEDVRSEFPQIQGVEVDIPAKQVTVTHTAAFPEGRWVAAIEEPGDTYAVKRFSDVPSHP